MDIFKDEKITVLQILVISWKIMRTYFKEIVFLSILICLPTSLLFDLINPNNLINTNNLENPITLTLVAVISIGLVTLLYPLGIAYIIDKKEIGKEEIHSAGIFIIALNKLPIAIGASIIIMAAIIASTILIIVPLILAIYFSFVNQVIVIKKCNPIQAIAYSYKVVKGNWWRVFGNLVVFTLISFALVLIIQLLSVYIPVNIFTSSIIAIIGGITTGFSLICRTILFYNLDKASPKE